MMMMKHQLMKTKLTLASSVLMIFILFKATSLILLPIFTIQYIQYTFIRLKKEKSFGLCN